MYYWKLVIVIWNGTEFEFCWMNTIKKQEFCHNELQCRTECSCGYSVVWARTVSPKGKSSDIYIGLMLTPEEREEFSKRLDGQLVLS